MTTNVGAVSKAADQADIPAAAAAGMSEQAGALSREGTGFVSAVRAA